MRRALGATRKPLASILSKTGHYGILTQQERWDLISKFDFICSSAGWTSEDQGQRMDQAYLGGSRVSRVIDVKEEDTCQGISCGGAEKLLDSG